VSEIFRVKDVLADAAHPAHDAATDIVKGLKDGSISMCGCMGPMYGEPHCICTMERLGLPLNTEARAAAAAKSGPLLENLFGPGGIFYNKPKATK
jgi:hypothetical protein